ncbi:YdcH family protein [Sphingomicrobium flavum]|uniref:YdcH family protein n=1 Tax=Sphingomicrobium flavum TaxID=1229164 RepID=UPI0021ADC7AB|nr:YdcH family protein [Sphingomicrobium flavum]
MNDDDPKLLIAQLKVEHRKLDEKIERLQADPDMDQLELARLKKAKLVLKDRIARVEDDSTPDIIA